MINKLNKKQKNFIKLDNKINKQKLDLSFLDINDLKS